MADTKYSAQEAAIAVLKKAEELLKSSELAKARIDEGKSDKQKRNDRFERRHFSGTEAGYAGVHEPISPNGDKPGHGDRGQSMAGLYPRARKEGIKLDAQDKAIEAGEHKRVMESMPKPKLDKAQDGETSMKGHIKLAKFMGRMEHKRGQKAEPSKEKGVHLADVGDKGGTSYVGQMVREKGDKRAIQEEHGQALKEIKGIKPKLSG